MQETLDAIEQSMAASGRSSPFQFSEGMLLGMVWGQVALSLLCVGGIGLCFYQGAKSPRDASLLNWFCGCSGLCFVLQLVGAVSTVLSLSGVMTGNFATPTAGAAAYVALAVGIVSAIALGVNTYLSNILKTEKTRIMYQEPTGAPVAMAVAVQTL